MPRLITTVELTFLIDDATFDSLTDYVTGEIDTTRLASALNVTLDTDNGPQSEHDLRVNDATI